MKNPLRLLIIEDNPTHAMLAVRELQRSNYKLDWVRVENRPEMEKALQRHWDAVISDYAMPNFNPLDALRMVQNSGQDIPFIIMSGISDEETVVRALKAGAHDFIIKGSYARLTPALERELREAATRRARHQAEAATQRLSEQRKRQFDLSQKILSTLSVHEVVNHTLETIRADIHYDADAILWVDEKTGLLRFDSDLIPDWAASQFKHWVLPLDQGIAGTVARTGKAERVNDAHLDPRSAYPEAVKVQREHLISIPLRAQDKTIAVFSFSRLNEHATPFTLEEFETAQLYISQAALAVNNAQLFEQTQRSEKRFRELFEAAPVMYVITRNDRGVPIIADCNQLFLDTTGYTRAEVVNRPLTDFYSAESREKLLTGGYQQTLEGRFVAAERHLFTKNGASILTNLHAVPETDLDGNVIGTRAMFVDVTELRQTKDRLAASNALLQSAFEASVDGLIVFDLAGRITTYNQNLVEMWQIPASLLASGNMQKVCDHLLERIASHDGCTTSEQELTGQIELHTHHEIHLTDGRYFERYSQPHQLDNRIVGRVWNFRDITKRKTAEDEAHQLNVGLEQRIAERTVQLELVNDELRRQNAYQEALHETALGLLNRLNVDDLLKAIVTRASQLVGTTHGYLYFVDPQQNVLIARVATGVFSKYLGYRLARGQGLAGRVWEAAHPLVVDDYRNWTSRLPDNEFVRIRAIVGVPIYAAQEIVGVLGVAHTSDHGAFAEAEVNILERFAQLASLALDNARLYGALQRELSERKQAEATAQLAEKEYRDLFENMPVGIYRSTPEGRQLRANPALVQLNGYSNEAEMLAAVNDIASEWYINPQRRDDFKLLLEREGQIKDFESEIYRHKTRERIWISENARAIRDAAGNLLYYEGSVQDISDRKRAEIALQLQNGYLKDLHRIALDLLHHREVNDLLQKIISYATQLLESPWGDVSLLEGDALVMRACTANDSELLDKPQPRDPDAIAWQVIDSKLPIIFVDYDGGQLQPSAGTHRAARRAACVPIILREKCIGTLNLVRHQSDHEFDDTQLQIAMLFAQLAGLVLENAQLYADVQRQAAELTRSNADLQQFAYVASHDLQEPLRIIAGYTQLLSRRYKGKLDASADEFIQFAVDGASRMQEMIKALLDYSRVGRQIDTTTPIDCNVVLDTALDNLKFAVDDAQAEISRETLPVIYGHAALLTQVFQNLIGNALKFRSTAPLRIHVGVEPQAAEWRFMVKDNGIGIAPEHFQRIFVIFQRLHTREEYPGTGIGLATCKRIIERHGGRIWVESQEDVGSTFYFSLPRDAHTN